MHMTKIITNSYLNAAVPNVSDETILTDVFLDTYAMLTCPIPLPTLYTIIWDQVTVDSHHMQLMNDTESREYVLSQDNRTLSVLISDSIDQRAFQCRLRMQRCSLPENCQWEVTGPLMKVRVLGKLINIGIGIYVGLSISHNKI